MNLLSEELVDRLPIDVCDYVGIRREHFKDYCLNCTDALAAEWRRRNPQTPEEMAQYYQENWDWYIGDLAWWHTATEGRREWFRHHTDVLLDWKAKRVLDYGCGIGTDALVLAANGVQVTLADFPTPAFEFAKWRAKRYGLTVTAFTLPQMDNILLQNTYDCIFLIDVLEHIPQHHLRLLQFAARAWMLCVSAPFKVPTFDDPYHPQHLQEDSDTTISNLMGALGFHPFAGNFWIRKKVWEKRFGKEEQEELDAANQDA